MQGKQRDFDPTLPIDEASTPPSAWYTDPGFHELERRWVFRYPNLMLNRYGPILDTNWVLPLGHDRMLTVFDYYFEAESMDDEFVERSLESSDRVQQEDIGVCESVQRGLASSGFDRGRYAPTVEQAAYFFHGLLAENVRRGG